MAEQMRTFSFDGNTLEQMHGWMRQGQGVDGVQPAIDALSGLSRDLEHSLDRLRRALTVIGAWVGPAGDSADGATRQGEEWVVVSTPQVADSVAGTDAVASGFVSTQSRMPSPAEAELADDEHSVASSVPIIGPILDGQLADQKRDQVTNEARRRMLDWQHSAQDSVSLVQPLPPVPQPGVEVSPPRTISMSAAELGPTALSGVSSAAPSASAAPAVPPPSGGSAPPQLGNQLPPAGRPPAPAPAAPPVAPPPVPPAPVRPVPPGVPVLPVPLGGPGAGDTPGRRRAYGPGVFDSEEIARARGGTSGARTGVLGGAVADDGAQGRAAGARAAADGDEHGRGRGAAAGAGRGSGSIMQPAVGGGARGEDDQEHTDRYAVESDDYFVGEPHQVAPPVIGGP